MRVAAEIIANCGRWIGWIMLAGSSANMRRFLNQN
jgi:hypothetical protein